MGAYTADVNRDMYQESKRYIGLVAQQGPGIKPVVVDDINDGESIFFGLLRRLAEASLGDGFTGNAFKIASNSGTNDFYVTGGDGSDDGAARGYLAGIPVTKYATSSFSSTTVDDIHSKSTNLTSTVLTDTAANYDTNELIGRTLYPNIELNLGYLITANTATTITTAGNMLAGASTSDRYRIGLTTPTGTRTDTIVLDVYVDEIDSDEDPDLKHNISVNSGTVAIESAIRKKIEQKVWVKQNYSSTLSGTYTDSDGNVHYQTILATFTRTSGVSTIVNGITDTRGVDYPDLDRRFQNIIVEQSSQLSGTTTISGIAYFKNGNSTRPEFTNGINISAGQFDYNGSGSELKFDTKNSKIDAASGFTVVAQSGLMFNGTTTLRSFGSSSKTVQFYSNASGMVTAWIDGDGRFHSAGLADVQQVKITPSGSGDKALVVYDYPSGTEVAYLTESGRFYLKPEANQANPFFDLVGANNSSNYQARIKGSVDSGSSFLLLQNDSDASVPLARLVSSKTGLSNYNLFEAYRASETPGSTNPFFELNNSGEINLREHPSISSAAILSLRNGSNARKVQAHSSGAISFVPTATTQNVISLRNTSDNADILYATGSGVWVAVDDGSNIPGLVVKKSDGTNRSRVNVNGLVLSSAEFTQNPSNPTVLNILSNDGVTFNYDANDDSSGDTNFYAGSELIMTLGAKSAPNVSVKNLLYVSGIVANDGLFINYDLNNDDTGELKINAGSTSVVKLGSNASESGLVTLYRNVKIGEGNTSSGTYIQLVTNTTTYPAVINFKSNINAYNWDIEAAGQGVERLTFRNNKQGNTPLSLQQGTLSAVVVGDSANHMSFLDITGPIVSESFGGQDSFAGYVILSGTSVAVLPAYWELSNACVYLTVHDAVPTGKIYSANYTTSGFDVRSSSSESSIRVNWLVIHSS